MIQAMRSTADLNRPDPPTVRGRHPPTHDIAAAIVVICVVIGVVVVVWIVVVVVRVAKSEREGAEPKVPIPVTTAEPIAAALTALATTLTAEAITTPALSTNISATDITRGEGCAVGTDCRTSTAG
jgi:heme/copper-type cytochrome/quinol oxidase subunit 2